MSLSLFLKIITSYFHMKRYVYFMTKDDEKYILLPQDGGLNVKQIKRVMELEKNVRYGHF